MTASATASRDCGPKADSYDVIVLGGGPAGSTAATLLADRGFSVLVCEASRFPRFHVGESLLPSTAPLWRRLGVWQQLIDRGFQPKHGARFVFEPGGSVAELDFGRSLDKDRTMAFQVRRAEFDHLLLDNARQRGAEVCEECAVAEVLFDGDRAHGIRLADRRRRDQAENDNVDHGNVDVDGDGDEAGQRSREIGAKVVIDASGRKTMIGSQLRLKERDEALRQAAIYAHFEGAEMGIGTEGGDILVVGGPYGWFWLIPLDADTTSVGAVFPSRVLRDNKGTPDEVLRALIAQSPEVSKRLDNATIVRPAEATADFSYRCSRLAGDGWVLVGDAAGFLDPVFSSGVLLAMRSAERAADRIAWVLKRRGAVDRADLMPYERFASRGLARFRRYILSYYDIGGVANFSNDPPPILVRAATSVFGGKVFERDPRTFAFDRAFFGTSALWRWLHKRGKAPQLIPPPAMR